MRGKLCRNPWINVCVHSSSSACFNSTRYSDDDTVSFHRASLCRVNSLQYSAKILFPAAIPNESYFIAFLSASRLSCPSIMDATRLFAKLVPFSTHNKADDTPTGVNEMCATMTGATATETAFKEGLTVVRRQTNTTAAVSIVPCWPF